MKSIDLRSDTLTKPSPEMWETLRGLDNSKIGDDVYHEDPTVKKLESKAAKKVGKQAALYVATGTMGNLISTLAQTSSGQEVMYEEMSHMAIEEVGGPARISQVVVKMFPSTNGIPNLDYLERRVFDGTDIHQARTSFIALENTHNYHGGKIIPPSIFRKTREFVNRHNMKFHVDGARIFNAAIGSAVPVTRFTQHVDSVMFCLSKGLSCPIGSIIAGTSEFIKRARKFRKMVGGGWRQAGIMASMGIVALEDKWIRRLEEDHKNAKILAKGISSLDLDIDVVEPDTNILVIKMPEQIQEKELVGIMEKNGLLSLNIYPKAIRFVTHYGITKEDIERAIEIIKKSIKSLKS